MSGQIAKLFLRGSLVNVTARNLTRDQKQLVDDLMQAVWTDPRLDNAKHEFCQALGRTIGGEYADKDYAMQEVWITLWRTAVDVLFHNPKTKVVQDEIVRKKHFQTCIFNYLRQILAENKIPTAHAEREIAGPASQVAKDIIKFIFDTSPEARVNYTTSNNGSEFHVETTMLPLDLLEKIWKLNDELVDAGVKLAITDNSIQVIASENEKYVTRKLKEKVRVSLKSFTGTDEDDSKNGFQQHCEYQAIEHQEETMDHMTTEDTVSTLKNRLPAKAQKILEILLSPPQDLLDTYYPNRKKEVRPREVHIAEWLGIPADDVAEAIRTIQEQAAALDIS